MATLPLSEHDDRFVGLVGLEVTHDDDGVVRGRLEVTERVQQPYGIVHGGVYCTIVETLASHAAAVRAMADGNIVVGVSNTTDFLRATRSGVLEAVAEPIHVGRTQHLWRVRIWRAEDGKDVAQGQVRLQVLPGDGDLAGAPPDVAPPRPA